MFSRRWQRWFPLVCFALAVVVQALALRLDWKADTQNHPKLQSMKVQSGYELHLENAPDDQSQRILSYEASDEHDHVITLAMANASLTEASRALLPVASLSNVHGNLLYAPDDVSSRVHTGKSCRTAFQVDFSEQAASRKRSVSLYPPGPEEFKQLDRLRVIHLRSRLPVTVRISANSQDGESGPNCRNRLSIGSWEQLIGKDVELAFIAAPDSEITLKMSVDLKSGDRFRSGKDELESFDLEVLHPALLAVSPLRLNGAEQIRRRAGPPFMTVTNLRLGGDFCEVDLSGLVGLRVSDLLGAWKWPLMAFVNVPLLVWAGRAFHRAAQSGTVLTPILAECATERRNMRVFLSYSWGDKERVMKIYDLLEAAGADPWIDREEIRGGADWELSIKQRMRDSERVIVFLSKASLQKAGYAWAEIRMAARIAEEQPEGTPFVIPVKLDDCGLPDLLSRWNCVALNQPDGEKKLLQALGLAHAGATL